MSQNKSGIGLILMLPIAVVVTGGIFLLMSGLIDMDVELEEDVPPQVPDIFMSDRESPRPPDPIDPTKFPEETPKEPKPVFKKVNSKETGGIPLPDPNPVPNEIPVITGPPGTIINPQPSYPTTCQSRGVEGQATVIFDVKANGAVVNARILSSSHPCFEKEALRTIRKWKYQPRSGNANTIVRSGVTQTFSFQLVE